MYCWITSRVVRRLPQNLIAASDVSPKAYKRPRSESRETESPSGSGNSHGDTTEMEQDEDYNDESEHSCPIIAYACSPAPSSSLIPAQAASKSPLTQEMRFTSLSQPSNNIFGITDLDGLPQDQGHKNETERDSADEFQAQAAKHKRQLSTPLHTDTYNAPYPPRMYSRYANSATHRTSSPCPQSRLYKLPRASKSTQVAGAGLLDDESTIDADLNSDSEQRRTNASTGQAGASCAYDSRAT